MSERILVTGHLGYIGTILVPMLLEAGYDVHGLDSDLFADCTFGEGIVEVPWTQKDIRDVEAADVEGFDAVVHLAGLSNDPLGDFNPELTYAINHAASVRLAELCKRAGVPRFVFSSSCSTYGAGGDDWLTEESEFHPVTPYGESKVFVERDVAKLADDTFCPVFLRNATVFGYSPRLRFDLVVNNLVAWAFCTGKIHLKSDGGSWRPLVHVADVSQAFLAALKAPREAVFNDAFNIGSTQENYQIREVAKIVGEVVPGSAVEFAPGASPDKRNYKTNCDKAARVLEHFTPSWTVRQGAEQLHEAYTRHGVELEEFEGERYQRLAHLKHLIDQGRLGADLRRVDA